MPRTDPTNKRDAAGDPICPVCETAITATDGLMWIGDSNEIAHLRCDVDLRIDAGRRTEERRS
jgi:hypothetical protein